MGGNSLLVQASGGNTSLKEDGILWVKASGKCLARAQKEDIFVELKISEVMEEFHSSHHIETKCRPLSNNGLRPSIETTLHAVMPHRVVLHSHAIDVIAMSLLPQSQDKIKKALHGIRWLYIPYKRPGKYLTQEVANALARQPADVLILANHGLVVGASNPDEAAALQAEVNQRLCLPKRQYSEFNKEDLSRFADSIDGAYMPKADVIHSLAIDPWSLELALRNPAYPDHVVFCGIRPWVMGIAKMPPSNDTKYGFIPGVGVFLLPAATPATEAMLQAQAEILLRIPPGEETNLLSDDQCNELLNWEAEKYRQNLDKSV